MLADGPAVERVMREAAPLALPGAVGRRRARRRRTGPSALPHSQQRPGSSTSTPVLGARRRPSRDSSSCSSRAGGRAGDMRAVLPRSRESSSRSETSSDRRARGACVTTLDPELAQSLAETVARSRTALRSRAGAVPRVIAGGGVPSPRLRRRRPILSGKLDEPSFPLRLAAKDVELILDAASSAGVDLALAARPSHACHGR